MTYRGPDDYPGGHDAWTAALGEVNDPTNPDLSVAPAYAKRSKHRGRRIRVALLVLVVVGGLGGAIYAVARSGPAPKDAGAVVGSVSVSNPPPGPSSAGSTSGAVVVANTSTAHALQLTEAMTAATSWAQLVPFLKNYSTQGVSLACLNVTSSNESKCKFGAKPATHHAVLVGDAAALNYLPGILAELAPHGWDVQVLTMANCPLSKVAITVGKKVDSACADHHGFITAQLASIKPSLIFSSDSEIDLSYATAPPKPKGKNVQRQTSEEAFVSGMTSAVEAYAKVGKVVVIGSAPGSKRLSECISGVPAPKGCVDGLRTSWKDYQKLESKVISGHGDYLDPTAYFCHLDRCPAIVGVTPVYIDGTTVSEAFAKSLSFIFAPYINAS